MAALLLALPVSGNKPISTLWTGPFETCGQASGIGQRQPTASNAPPGRASDSRCTGAGECKGFDSLKSRAAEWVY